MFNLAEINKELMDYKVWGVSAGSALQHLKKINGYFAFLDEELQKNEERISEKTIEHIRDFPPPSGTGIKAWEVQKNAKLVKEQLLEKRINGMMKTIKLQVDSLRTIISSAKTQIGNLDLED